MYKKILTIFALAASLLACNKVENEVVAPENGAKTLTITATIGDPDTRLSYSEATDGSYKARFNENDVVWAYFAKADNSVAGPVTKLAIDPKSISFDGKTACFRQPAVSIPEGSTKIIAYLANTANTTNFDGGDDIVSDISSQANLTAALNNQVIYGAVDFKDLTSTNPDALAASIPFSYKTSLLKFSLALPEGTEVDPKAAVSVTLANGKIHNKLHISGGVLGAKSEEGDLNLGATVANGVVTAYAAVWAADDLNSKIFVTIDKDSFLADFKPSATIAAGKAYTVERAVTKVSMETKWIADEAGSVEFLTVAPPLSLKASSLTRMGRFPGPRTRQVNLVPPRSSSPTALLLRHFRSVLPTSREHGHSRLRFLPRPAPLFLPRILILSVMSHLASQGTLRLSWHQTERRTPIISV